MKSVFLGESKKALRFADQKYNIGSGGLSPFMPVERGSNPSLLKHLLEQERRDKEKLTRKALNQSPKEQKKTLAKQKAAMLSPTRSNGSYRTNMTLGQRPGHPQLNATSRYSVLSSYKRQTGVVSPNRHKANHGADAAWKRGYVR